MQTFTAAKCPRMAGSLCPTRPQIRSAHHGDRFSAIGLETAGTPSDMIEKISKDIKEAVAAAEVRDKLIAQGAVPQSSTPAELQKLIDADRERYGKIIRDKGLKAE